MNKPLILLALLLVVSSLAAVNNTLTAWNASASFYNTSIYKLGNASLDMWQTPNCAWTTTFAGLIPEGDFAISLWYRYDTNLTANQDRAFIAINETTVNRVVHFGYGNDALVGNRLRADVGGQAKTLNYAISNLTWHHIVFQYTSSGTSGKIWIDNANIWNITGFGAGNLTGNVYIGGAPWTGCAQPTQGRLDDVRIFNNSLSETNITSLYNGGNGTNLTLGNTEVGWYGFDGSLNDGSSAGEPPAQPVAIALNFTSPPTPTNNTVLNSSAFTANLSSSTNLSKCNITITPAGTANLSYMPIAAGHYLTMLLYQNGSGTTYGYYGTQQYNGNNAVAVYGGGSYCYLLGNGNVACFGDTAVNYTGGDAIDVSNSHGTECILRSNKNSVCYGDNTYGQAINYTGGDATKVAGGIYHTNYLLSNGNIVCYGSNNMGQCVNYTGGDAIDISAGITHTCIIKTGGAGQCWGLNVQSATGWTVGQPTIIANYTSINATRVSSGLRNYCFLLTNGNVTCYGEYHYTSTTVSNYTSGDAIGVAAGGTHDCFLKNNYQVTCTGNNIYGAVISYTGSDLMRNTSASATTYNMTTATTTASYNFTGLTNGTYSYLATCTAYDNTTTNTTGTYWLTVSSNASANLTANLTVLALNGTATGNVTNLAIPANSTITSLPTNSNYTFTSWSAQGNCTINTQAANTTVEVRNNCNVTANYQFSPETFNITISTPANGSNQNRTFTVNASISSNVSSCWFNLTNYSTAEVAANASSQHNLTLVTNSPNTDSNPSGMKIVVNSQAINITAITKSALSGANTAQIRDASFNLLSSASFVGDVATFNYQFSAGTTYYLTVWNNGFDFTHGKNITPSFPIATTYLNWTGGRFAGSDSSSAWDIANVSFIYGVGGSTQTEQRVNMTVANNGALTTAQAQAVNLTLGQFYNITSYCLGVGGVLNESGKTTVFINTTAPRNVQIVTPANNTQVNYTVNVRLNYTTSNFKNCTLQAGSTNYTMANISSSQCEYNLTEIYGSFDLIGYVADTADNVVASEAVRINAIPAVTDCSVSNTTRILLFSFFSQDATTTPMASTMEATFTLRNGISATNYSFNFSTPSNNISICINQSNGTYYIDSIQKFKAEGHRELYYFMVNQSISVPTQYNISLYNLNSTGSVATQYLVLTGASTQVENAYVQIQRYYPSTGQLILVSMGKTNVNGVATSYAVANDVIYRYIIIENNMVSFTSGTSAMPCDPASTVCITTIYVSQGTQNEYAYYVDGVGFGCAHNESNSVVYCTSTNPGGTGTALNLKLYELGTYTNTLVCDQTLNAGSGTVICSVPNTTKAYYWIGKATIGSDLVQQGNINLDIIKGVSDSIGLFATMLLVVGMGLFGMVAGFGGAIIMAIIGLILAVLFKMISISLTYLMIISVVGVALAWLLRG